MLFWPSYRTNSLYGLSNRSKVCCIDPDSGQMPFMGSVTGQMSAVLAQIQVNALYGLSYRSNAFYGLSNRSNAWCIGPVTRQMPFMGPVTGPMSAVLTQLQVKCPLLAQLQVQCLLYFHSDCFFLSLIGFYAFLD